jgi:hypothetical protein
VAGRDQRVVEVGAPLRGQGGGDRAPRLARDEDALLAEAAAQVLRHLDRVGDHPFQRQRRGGIERRVRAARPPLVPGDDHEPLLEPGVEPHRADVGAAGPAGEVEEHRQVGAAAADHEGLRVAADRGGRELGDAAGEHAAVAAEDRRRRGGPGDGDADRGEDERDGARRDPAPGAQGTGDGGRRTSVRSSARRRCRAAWGARPARGGARGPAGRPGRGAARARRARRRWAPRRRGGRARRPP